jgi:hypothetical protein
MTRDPADWMILAFVAILALFGFARAASWGRLFGGFALGAFIGTRLGPLLLPQGSSSPTPRLRPGRRACRAIPASGMEGFWRLRRGTA